MKRNSRSVSYFVFALSLVLSFLSACMPTTQVACSNEVLESGEVELTLQCPEVLRFPASDPYTILSIVIPAEFTQPMSSPVLLRVSNALPRELDSTDIAHIVTVSNYEDLQSLNLAAESQIGDRIERAHTKIYAFDPPAGDTTINFEVAGTEQDVDVPLIVELLPNAGQDLKRQTISSEETESDDSPSLAYPLAPGQTVLGSVVATADLTAAVPIVDEKSPEMNSTLYWQDTHDYLYLDVDACHVVRVTLSGPGCTGSTTYLDVVDAMDVDSVNRRQSLIYRSNLCSVEQQFTVYTPSYIAVRTREEEPVLYTVSVDSGC